MMTALAALKCSSGMWRQSGRETRRSSVSRTWTRQPLASRPPTLPLIRIFWYWQCALISFCQTTCSPGWVYAWACGTISEKARWWYWVTDAMGPADPSPSLLDYLQTAAAVGGLVFFPRRRSIPWAFDRTTRPAPGTCSLRSRRKSRARVYGLAYNRAVFRP